MRRGLGVLAFLAGVGTACPGFPVESSRLMSNGRHLAQDCTGCHRLDGVDNGIPSIVGWEAERFLATLKLYRTGERTNPVMVSVVASLDEEQMQALAAYYSSLPKPAARGKK